jgi:choline-glycine betaine transporter
VEESNNKVPPLQVMRGVLEAIIVAALLWTGNSLIELKTQVAIAQTQLAAIQVSLADVPSLQLEDSKQKEQILQLSKDQSKLAEDVKELRKLRGMR